MSRNRNQIKEEIARLQALIDEGEQERYDLCARISGALIFVFT